MPRSVEDLLVEFVDKIPADINPYAAVARRLIQLLHPPLTPCWARWLQRAVLLGFVIIFVQCSFFIYTRTRMKMFRVFSFDQLGLLNVDVHIVVVGYLVHSAIVITDIILDEVFRNHFNRQGIRMMLFGFKFILILDCSWVFLWACVCKCASLKWKSSTHSRNYKKRIPKILLWSLHLSLICMLVWPIPLVFCKYAKACDAYNHISHIIHKMVRNLLKSAATISPASYEKPQLLLSLVYVQRTEPLLEELMKSVRLGILAYLIDTAIVCSTYIPFLIFSLRALSLRRLSEAYYAETLVDVSVAELTKFRSMSTKTRTEWDSIMLHAAIAYMGILAELPAMIWQLTLTCNGLLCGSSWALATRLGLTGPSALAGITSLFLLHRNSKIERPDPEDHTRMVKSTLSGKPDEGFKNSPETSLAAKSRAGNHCGMVRLDMQRPFWKFQCSQAASRGLGNHGKANQPIRPRSFAARLEEITMPPRVHCRPKTLPISRNLPNFDIIPP